jgi:glycosyltransferase involved in cell wall biosynthesis
MNGINFDIQFEVSIILCSYNRANHLKRCIDSVLNQTFTNWELLIIDDGSEDNTFEVVNPYIMQFSNIRYFKHKNRRLAHSRNVGIVAAAGRYITSIDSDDAYMPNHLESRWNYMQENPDVDLIQGGFYIDGDVWVANYYKPGEVINIKECVVGPTFFGKRNVFTDLKGFDDDTSVFDDTDFWERAELRFNTVKLSQPETYIYTRAETSITKTVVENISTGA